MKLLKLNWNANGLLRDKVHRLYRNILNSKKTEGRYSWNSQMLKIMLHTDLSYKTSNQTINAESMDRNSFTTVIYGFHQFLRTY